MSKLAGNQTLELLRGKLRVHMNEMADALAGGICRDYAEYREMAGKIHGLAIAERELLELDEKLTFE